LPDTDFTAVIQGLIAEELARRLFPYQRLLARLDQLRVAIPARRGPGRPSGAELNKIQSLFPPRNPAALAFAPGEIVSYRQGRGEFRARVVRTDPQGRVVIERQADGKRVTRPAAKLFR
jgi:hypothetical protein